MFIGGSIVAEHLLHHPKVEGSNPATSTGREKVAKNIRFPLNIAN
jgi:hypothetical protein